MGGLHVCTSPAINNKTGFTKIRPVAQFHGGVKNSEIFTFLYNSFKNFREGNGPGTRLPPPPATLLVGMAEFTTSCKRQKCQALLGKSLNECTNKFVCPQSRMFVETLASQTVYHCLNDMPKIYAAIRYKFMSDTTCQKNNTILTQSSLSMLWYWCFYIFWYFQSEIVCNFFNFKKICGYCLQFS